MSTKVVPAPAVQAKQPVRSDKPANQTDEQQAVNQGENRAANDSEKHVSVASAEQHANAAHADVNANAAPADEKAGAGSEEVAAAHAVATGEQVADADASAPADGSASTDMALAGDFTFGAALAEAAATSGSLTSEAESADHAGFSQFGEDGGSTILLIGAIALVGLGVYVLADSNGNDGGNGDNSAPTIDVADIAAINEDDAAGATFAVTTDDADGDDVTVTATSDDGTITQNEDGTFTFHPTADFNGDATVHISATDGIDTTNHDVTVVVNPVNDAAVLETTSLDVAADTPVDLTTSLVFTDVDGDNDAISATPTTNPEHGTLSTDADGDVIYTPDAGYTGSDHITFNVVDDQGLAATYTLDINVGSVEHTDQSIDVGSAGTSTAIDAGDDNYNFTDDSSVLTNVDISNFAAGDIISVTGAEGADYNFIRSTDDAHDLFITYTDTDSGATNTITIQDVLPDTGVVGDLASAQAAVGFEFITFG